MTLNYAGVMVEHREVLLRDKPQAMLEASAKATVPILKLPNGSVIDESIDVMKWALEQRDTDHWWQDDLADQSLLLVDDNDFKFKEQLDHYKYADRHPQHSQRHFRTEAEQFLLRLENRLIATTFLLDEQLTFSDVAIFPFIRQFAYVDMPWFDQAPYPKLRAWLLWFLDSELFINAMGKQPLWDGTQST
jgi:glutathione S-transferase